MRNLTGAFCAFLIIEGTLRLIQAEPLRKPRIAVVIDDFGVTYPKNVPDGQWMEIRWPITFAVMPESPRTSEAAAETKKTGHELLVHFPFDPFLPLELPEGRASSQDLKKVRHLLEKARKEIPGAVGLNNHRSVRATQNPPLMAAFMRMIKPTGLFFIDSRVSPRSLAYDEAKKAGVKTARNFIFLEEPGHYDDEKFAAQMLERAAAHARKRGSALVIGHHYFRGTYRALQKEAPKLEAEGFEFVFASEIVR